MATESPEIPLSRADEVAGAGVIRGRVEDRRPMLFEIAWEVCNKVGGIYQVIRSKAPTMVERWDDRYCVVGPYFEKTAHLEFEPTRPEGAIGRAVNVLRDAGLVIHHGRWLISSKPRALLIEHGLTPHRLNELKHRLWEHHGVSLLGADPICDGPLGFGDAVYRLLTAICQLDGAGSSPESPHTPRPVVAHFHEWMGGLALPMLRRSRLPVATVFTTHATLLGRYLASNQPDFYERLPTLDQREEAFRYSVSAQHQIERSCAHGAHIFSTVSTVTGEECRHLLGREPDAILPNGLNLERVSASHDLQQRHFEYKARIDLFTMGHFFPSYSFDLDKTLYFFTSGRFEPHNKGFDLCLESCARLNAEIKAAGLDVNVVFFIVTNQPVRSLLPEALQSRGVLSEVREVSEQITEQLGDRLFREAAAGRQPDLSSLVDEYWWLRLRRTQHAFRSEHTPPVVTHQLANEAGDPVLNHIRALWMTNRAEDPVKVVYHPQFIGPDNPLWGMEYEHFVRGCHMGVFPSAYEPWGYTPLECASVGVESISSDLSGFGRYVQEHFVGAQELGMDVLPRRGRSFSDAAADLTARLLQRCRMDSRERDALRNATERQSFAFSWSKLAACYHDAHDRALAAAGLRRAAPKPR